MPTASYKTVAGDAAAELCEKKSVFIGSVRRVETEAAAKSFISEVSAKHRDASHNVYCYVLRENGTVRFSDAGEPSGTAGRPALDILLREKVTDVCLVVTRYFGGTLLGAGGLTRAYARAAKEALDQAGVVEMRKFLRFSVEIGYKDWAKAEPALARIGARLEDVTYGETVAGYLYCVEKEAGTLETLLKDITAGRAKFEATGEVYRGSNSDKQARV